MPTLETYKKQAKQLVRWHRDRDYSVGGRIRQLPRYRDVTDHESFALNFKLAEAQEIIALEAGYDSWAALRAAVEDAWPRPPEAPKAVLLDAARPVLFVRDVRAAAEFYRDRLGFRVDFLHGHPPFYGSVSRDDATLHLRFVHAPVLIPDTARDEGLIMAYIEARNVKDLYAEYLAAGVEPAQKLTKQAWGGTDFIVRDLDGNTVAFVG
ncbi:glyoxalase/bleomycin resistance/extradiol dioxygenase family protein [Kribbella capetownensis]|uniref:Glyoxalase/bleomycin resistance/extradiol dioxygenase family protein n=1 Tax=Kribbella capetownensis TaxID=1572659 RepID=A0A4V2M6V5_9ACTN|nr:glyoxalase superfamily protein [Kribbella capetownensis]TCC45152.1 glyoxalase/bleomycin resistance/extradiol dioxygenase family protein [Kribbella capetownensis]